MLENGIRILLFIFKTSILFEIDIFFSKRDRNKKHATRRLELNLDLIAAWIYSFCIHLNLKYHFLLLLAVVAVVFVALVVVVVVISAIKRKL